MIQRFATAVAAAALVASPASAQSGNVTAANPQSLVSGLQRAGLQAKLKQGEDGDPYIESAANGDMFVVFFYGCKKAVACETVQFYAGYTNHKATLASINDWNRDNRFGRAHLAKNGSARIEMDLDLDDGGVSPLLFEDNVEFWTAIMGKFAAFIAK